MPDPGLLAGEPRDRKYYQPRLARAGTWLVWWVLLMSLWVMLDGSLATDELLAGAGAAAIAALVAELATYQAETMVLHQLVTKGGRLTWSWPSPPRRSRC